MSENAIEVSHGAVRYGRLVAVDRVAFTVPRGSVYALLGRNGAGKSSLVRCILGQREPLSGRGSLFDQDAWKQRAALMQRVGVVSEEADAPPEMTVDQLAHFCSDVYARWNRSEVDARLRRFEVARDSRFGALSKGQKKQVLLALAL